MIHLRAISLKRPAEDLPRGFPFDVPIVRTLGTVTFDTPVTFLVGENGSGKSTLLEALAAAVGSVTVGSSGVETDQTLAHARALGAALGQTWTRRTRRGFFLRAEDFFGYARRVAEIREEARRDRDEVDRTYEGRSELAKALARGVHSGTISALDSRYGDGLDAQSHGESFLKLFQTRMVPGGLHLLDEPEAPLSPLRQLAFLSLVKEAVAEDAQFIIATHSPILLAFPGAAILSCDRAPMERVEYEDLEHVNLTRDILNDPERYMRQI